MAKPKQPKEPNRYVKIINQVFKDHFRPELTEFEFTRKEFFKKAEELGINIPDNLGDLPYSFRSHRMEFPDSILETAPEGKEWIIEGAGRSKYRFRQVTITRIVPRDDLVSIKIPDATPEIIESYKQSDEQALLAKVRYNRLIDIFLGITAYSLQNHLRTSVGKIGQIEIDEVYVGVDRYGRQFVVPVQAKGKKDKHAVVQTFQDIACCAEKFPTLICRPISAQFMIDDRIALFELTIEDGSIKVHREKHYKLVAADAISADDLREYQRRSPSY